MRQSGEGEFLDQSPETYWRWWWWCLLPLAGTILIMCLCPQLNNSTDTLSLEERSDWTPECMVFFFIRL